MSKRKSNGRGPLFSNLLQSASGFAVALIFLFRPGVALGDFWDDCVCPATGHDEIVSYDCDDVTYEGCCQGDFVTWCESGKLHCRNCVAAGEICSWDMIWQFYGCDDTSNPMEDPSGYNPIDCEFAHCDTDTDTDTDTDADCDFEGVLVGGSCWYLAEPNESCTETCSTHDGYDEATKTFAGSAGTAANCKAVLNALGGYNYWKGDICGLGGIGCHKYTGNGWRDLTPTTADTAPWDRHRD
jgi:hypothetical protein